MYVARVSTEQGVSYGVVHGLDEQGLPTKDTVVDLLTSHPFGELERADVIVPLGACKVLAPVIPSKVVCIGKNYADHAREMGGEPPTEPVIFIKPNTSVIGPNDPILLPWQSERVDYEAELGIVIGRIARNVARSDARSYVLGYTLGNDVTARDLQTRDGQWTRAKGFDTFCPLGPWIVNEFDPDDKPILCVVDGEVRQRASTSDMIHDVDAIVEFVSGVMTLLPGDVILTGTPAGIGPITDGQEVTVSVQGLGALTNPVRA